MTVRDVDTPKTARGELLLRVRAVGICGSDIHGYDGSTGRRMPPIVMGHEAAGEDVEVGDDCTNGFRVGVSCDAYKQDGAFAEYVVVPERAVYLLPE